MTAPSPSVAPSPPHAAFRGEQYGRSEAGKYFVPGTEEEWNSLADTVRRYVESHGVIAPLPLSILRTHAASLAAAAGLSKKYHEFLMILLNNEVWGDIVASIPPGRRTLLLPPCLRASGKCQAQFDELGLLCERCGSCEIGRLSDEAESLGYAVIVAEGTSIVADLIRKGMIDAVIGVSCMPSLERTFPHIFDKAVPGLAIPLMKEGCQDTNVCTAWVRKALHRSATPGMRPFLDLKKLHSDIQDWFAQTDLKAILKAGDSKTETVSLEWFAKAGKRWRPFLATAVYEALRADPGAPLPEPVRRVAIALECIHKASLIYDDVQDNDEQRYGEETVHQTEGVPVALTASLYLLGQGYRLIADSGFDPTIRTAMLQLATKGHCDLCLGQGAELCWMRDPKPLTPDQVLDIFRWKTAPSFEVVLRLGAMCADTDVETHKVLSDYSLAIGIAYQIADDLDDFKEGADVDDIKSARPSIVVASAHAKAPEPDRTRIAEAWYGSTRHGASREIRDLILRHDGDEGARETMERFKTQAIAAIQPLRNRDLKLLLHRIVAMVFDAKG
jgi:geranylgeranyl pyrophosphate synthase